MTPEVIGEVGPVLQSLGLGCVVGGRGVVSQAGWFREPSCLCRRHATNDGPFQPGHLALDHRGDSEAWLDSFTAVAHHVLTLWWSDNRPGSETQERIDVYTSHFSLQMLFKVLNRYEVVRFK